MELLKIHSHDNILIIAPHPDDECIGPGGVLSEFPDQCSVVVLTDGAIGQGHMNADKCATQRKNEFILEMKSIGVERYYWLGYPDGMLMNYLNCLDGFNLKQYTKIFVTGENDGHADHTAAYRCTIHALKKQNVKSCEVYQYEIHSPLQRPTHYLDITEYIHKKEELIRFHQSQLEIIPYDEYIRVESIYRAIQNRMPGKMIEVYKKIISFGSLVEENSLVENELQKFKVFYNLLVDWLMEADSEVVQNWCTNNQITEVIIYGYAELGKILEKQLIKCGVKVAYILDQKITQTCSEVFIYKPGNENIRDIPVIVTAIYYYDSIKNELEERGYTKIVSLQSIV